MTLERADQLSVADKKLVLSEIRGELQRSCPQLLQAVGDNAPGGLAELEANLDKLVAIVRRSDAEHIEPYLAQIHDDICSKCPHQEHSHFCPLRYDDKCVLYVGVGPIVAATRRALREIEIEHELARKATH